MASESTFQASDMVPIAIREFLTGSQMPVDVYIRLGGEKYVLIAKEDSKTQIEQLQSYQSKAVDYLFVRRSDYDRYVGANLVVAGVVISRNEIAANRRADFLARAGSAVMKEIEVLGFGPQSYEHAKLVAQATTTLVEAKPDLFNVMQSLAKLSDELLAHSVAVSAVSVMIAKAQGWTKPATFEKLALGALLHDIGLKEIPIELTRKPRAELTFDELQVYESHSFRGMELLRSVPSVPDDVAAIVYEHHENSLGQGYPRKIRDMRINPLAKVVALADTFVELTLKNPSLLQPKSAHEAIRYIESVMGAPFNRESFTALKVVAGREHPNSGVA